MISLRIKAVLGITLAIDIDCFSALRLGFVLHITVTL